MCACVTGGFERKYRPVPLLKVFQLRASPRSERLACESPRFRPHGGGGIPATSPLMANPRPRTLPPLLRDPPPALTCPPLALRRANGAPSPPALLASFVPTLCHRAASTVGSLTGAACYVLYVPPHAVANVAIGCARAPSAEGVHVVISASRRWLLHLDIDRLFRLLGCSL